MTDPIAGELEQLGKDADVLAQQVEAAQAAAASEEHVGEDSTGTVTVRLARDGSVHAVVVDRAWRDALTPDQVDGAVLEAYGAAIALRLEHFSAAFEDVQEQPPAPRPASGSDFTRQLRESIAADRFDDTALAGLTALLTEVTDGLERFTEQLAALAAATHTGRSRAGHVRATVSAAGELTGVTYDVRWLVGAHEFNIGRETTEAVRDAVDRARQHSVVDALADTEIGRLTAAAQDPEKFFRRLRP